MKKLLTNPKLYSFFALLCIINSYAYVLVINDYASRVRHLFIPEMLFGSPIGMILAGFLCPLFLSSPGRKKSGTKGVIFILAILLPNIVIRSLGFEIWLSSPPLRTVLAFFTGMFYTLSSGLFIFSFIKKPEPEQKEKHENLTGRYCIFLISLAWSSMIMSRYITLPLFEFFGVTGLFNTANLAFIINSCLVICTGVFCIITVILQTKSQAAFQAEKHPDVKLLSGDESLNIKLIFNLFGLAVVYQILNTILEIRLFSLTINYISGQNIIPFIFVAVTTLIFGFIAGYSFTKFLRVFLPCAAILFFLLPCLVLFDTDPPMFILLLQNTTGSVIFRLITAVFTVAVVEIYLQTCFVKTPGRGKGYWFFLLAGIMNTTNILMLLSQKISAAVPQQAGYTVLIVSIAAIIFLALSIRIIFPKIKPPEPVIIKEIVKETVHAPTPLSGDIQKILEEHNISNREKDVALLLINEGLGTKEIGERLFISPLTVKDHIKQIFRKFNVNKRSEFIALFVKSY